MSYDNLKEYEEDKILDEQPVEEPHIQNPFSTKDIKITNAIVLLPSLINRLKYNEIVNPDFQRNADLWTNKQMSRLIESILLKLPLPVFYFDVSNPEKWIIVDGLQRISTIKKFFVDKKLRLNHLEFLTNLNGKMYEDLDRSYQRTIDDTEFITYQIEAQTPKKVRYSIFNRINTGGLTLNEQEIRQALNQEGLGVKFLEDVCSNKDFKKIVGMSSKRMIDRELTLRFISFKLNNEKAFNFNNMSDFLDDSMEKLDQIVDESILKKLKEEFISILIFSEQILGKGHRFSRSLAISSKTKTLNRSLFDVITVSFSRIADKKLFLLKKDLFLNRFKALIKDERSDFSKSITEGSNSKQAIEKRFTILNNLIEEVINENR